MIVFALCVTGATYAYFALTASNNSVTGTVGGATLSLNVTKLLPSSTATTNMIPQLESTLDEAISDSYNCIDDNGNVVCQVYKATVINSGNASVYLNGTISFGDVSSLPNLKWKRIESSTTIGSYTGYKALSSKAMFENNKLFDAGDSETYYFVIWINETGEVQTDSGTFRATINFESANGVGVTSTVRPEDATGAAATIQNLYNDGSELTTVNIGGLDTKPTVTLNTTQGIMLDNNGEYRYYGADPNNYVTFNGELWRIIGVFSVRSDENDPVGERRVKIIRNESIGDYSWDSSDSTVNSGYGENEWSTADLNTELNSLYYNSGSGTCYNGESNASTTCDFTSIGLNDTAKELVDDALWHLGGISGYYDTYASDFYDSERGTSVYSTRSTRWIGVVGLMYPSDYMYAADLSVCTVPRYNLTDSSLDYRNTNCTGTNWLYKDSTMRQWTLSPFSGHEYRVFGVTLTGYIYYPNASDILGVWPVTYLKSDVTISGGEGTSTNPYTLSGT